MIIEPELAEPLLELEWRVGCGQEWKHGARTLCMWVLYVGCVCKSRARKEGAAEGVVY